MYPEKRSKSVEVRRRGTRDKKETCQKRRGFSDCGNKSHRGTVVVTFGPLRTVRSHMSVQDRVLQ
jgi:hypothetical protein